MHLARHALLLASEGEATVTAIAMAHGFWQLGRFSVDYRGLFGEAPSATLRHPVVFCGYSIADPHAPLRLTFPLIYANPKAWVKTLF